MRIRKLEKINKYKYEKLNSNMSIGDSLYKDNTVFFFF